MKKSSLPQDNNVERRFINKDFRFKLVLVGCFGVGKTSLMLQHFERYFTEDPKTTVGVDFRQRKFHLNNASVILEVWDTAGEEKYANIVQVYYRGAHAVVAVYDIRKKSTFDRALKYIEDIVSQAIPPLVVALVGNKQDLNEEREVQYEDALNHANANNLLFLETSAKTSTNVDQMFETISEKLVEEVVKRKTESVSRKQFKLNATQVMNNKKKCCLT